MDSADLTFSLFLSLRVAAIATIASGILGIGIAYLLTTHRFRGHSIVEALLMLPLILPPTVIGYYLLLILGRQGPVGHLAESLFGWTLLFSPTAAVIASTIVALPLVVRTSISSIRSVDRAMIDTATTLGYSSWEIFLRIVLPLSWKGVLAGLMLAFARAMGEFGATLMIAGNIPGKTNTLALSIYTHVSSGDWGMAHLVAIILTVTSCGFLLIAGLFDKRGWRS